MGFGQDIITIVLFLLILGTLVVVHELGHFVSARLANVRVLEFGIGFPPRAKVMAEGKPSPQDVEMVKRRREQRIANARLAGDPQKLEEILDEEPEQARGTLYTLNWLPIGGFVKLEGEDGDETDDPRSFSNAPLRTRLLILLAGVAMNLVAAFTIFTLIAGFATPLSVVRVPLVQAGSPAEIAGLRPGDAIESVDGRTQELFGVYVGERDLLDELRGRLGETVVLGVVRADGTRENLQVTLRSADQIDRDHGPLGISGPPGGGIPIEFSGAYERHDPVTAISKGASQTIAWFGLILDGLGRMASSFIADPGSPPDGVSGPIGIAQGIGQVFWTMGPIMTLYVAGILSANLALVNILPFPPLDGGRMLMLVLKRIFGRRISLSAERLTYFVGFAFLMAFLIWVTFFDITRGTPT